jgi:uncharacterized membrane protein YcaP (DUF421 family)
MVALRLMGKREIGQLSVFDFVVSIMLAEVSAFPMEDLSKPIWEPLLAILGLVVLQVFVALLQMKSHLFRHWVDGEPSVLIEHGELKDREMKRMHYTVHDLLTQLRQKGFASIDDVEFAILETSGELSVFPKPEKEPLTMGDFGKRGETTTVPLPLIIDGRPVQKSLDNLKRDVTWLQEQVATRGYHRIEDVFYAGMDTNGALFFDAKDQDPL